MLQGRIDTGCARAGREKRVQRPCVERERSTDDLSHRYSQCRTLREVMFASGVWYCALLCVSLVASALAISLAAMVGHFRAREKSILTTQTFFSFFRPSAGATRRRRDAGEAQRLGDV